LPARAYTYAYATMGELLAWIIGWDLVLEYAVGAATVAVSWSGTLVSLLQNFGIYLPPALITSPFEPLKLADGSTVTGLINLQAVLIVCAISLLLMRGIQESARANGIIVILKVAVIIVFIAIGWSFVDSSNHSNYIPLNEGGSRYGWSGILRAAGVIFAYIGFDAVSTAAQEAKNPKRDMPIGIIGSLLVCTVLFILYAHVLAGGCGLQRAQRAEPHHARAEQDALHLARGADEDRRAGRLDLPSSSSCSSAKVASSSRCRATVCCRSCSATSIRSSKPRGGAICFSWFS
jgi:amino acid transporter